MRRDFAGEHVKDWAFLQLQEKRQQLGETPEQYVSSMLQLCARAEPDMSEVNTVRYLLRGLRPEMMERVAITNPQTPTEFLRHLQRLTHVGAMARHALLAMPSHPLPGFAASPPVTTGPGAVADPGPEASRMLYAEGPSRAPTTHDKVTTEMIGVLQHSIQELTTAVERLTTSPRRRFPPQRSRNQAGQAICYSCGRPGHIMRQCQARQHPPAGNNSYSSGNE